MPEPKPKPEVHRVAIAPHHRTGRGALSDCGWLPVSGHVFIDETKQRGYSRKHAIAWCWAKGGDWRRRIQPVVTDLREV